jgi:ribosomal protein S18 acetylase RimI-like enzyme
MIATVQKRASRDNLHIMTFAIRDCTPADAPALNIICLKTGDNGADATPLYKDPDLVGSYYAAPYAIIEPASSFVLTHEGEPCGYIVGAKDTADFSARCERHYFPPLRAKYPMPPADDTSHDAWIIRAIHRGIDFNEVFKDYPAHLHIDIMPIGQKHGFGRKLMEAFLGRMKANGVKGVHLGVGAKNLNAIAFYERMGFHRVVTHDTWIGYGIFL